MSAATDAFVNQNRDRLLAELKDFIRIPSISTFPPQSEVEGYPIASYFIKRVVSAEVDADGAEVLVGAPEVSSP